MDQVIYKAYQIAKLNLRSCYAEEGILAGKRNFVDFWARDSFWASFGALEIGDIDPVINNLNLFLREQRISGQIPYRIISINQFLKYLHIKKRFKKPIPNYNSVLGASVIDQNLLLIILIEKLTSQKENISWVEKRLFKLELAQSWNIKQDVDNDGLLEEGFIANWMDHIFKHGKLLISNVEYYQSLVSLSKLSKQFGNRELSKRYLIQSYKTKKAINKTFWNGEYYLDWIDFKSHYYFDTSANLLAILWGIANKEQSKKILKYTKEKAYDNFIPKANFPQYNPALTQPQMYLAWIHDYAGYRIWIGALYALTLYSQNEIKEAKKVLGNIAKKINQFKAVYELYQANGKPINRWFLYSNEKPFAWSAGFFIWAVKEIFGDI